MSDLQASFGHIEEQLLQRPAVLLQLLPGEDAVQAALEIQLRGHAAWLCALISGALTAREGGI